MLPNAKLKATHERGTYGLGFQVSTQNETLNGQICLDEKNKMDEKITDLNKNDKSPSRYQQGIDLKKN